MWVYGKAEPGWYFAAAVWYSKLAEEWRAKGYEVADHDPRLDKVTS